MKIIFESIMALMVIVLLSSCDKPSDFVNKGARDKETINSSWSGEMSEIEPDGNKIVEIENNKNKEEEFEIDDDIINPQDFVPYTRKLDYDSCQKYMKYIELPRDKDLELDIHEGVEVLITSKYDISFLSQFSDIKYLRIMESEEENDPPELDYSYVNSFDFIKDLKKLEYIRIERDPEFELNILKDNKNLKCIEFINCNIISDSKVSYNSVDDLSIMFGNFELSNISDSFPRLKRLQFSVSNCDDFSDVGELSELEYLYIRLLRPYKGIESIAKCKKLKYLELFSRYMDKEGLLKTELVDDTFLTNVENLYMLNCYVGSISPHTLNILTDKNIFINEFEAAY